MSRPKIRGTLIGLELFTAVGAIAGAIFVAFIGAVVLLLIIRLLRGAKRAP